MDVICIFFLVIPALGQPLGIPVAILAAEGIGV